MIKLHRPLITIVILLLASLACSTLLGDASLEPIPTPTPLPDLIIEATATPASDGGGGNEPTTPPEAATPEDGSGGGGGGNFNTDFPLPDTVSDFLELGNGAINFQTTMALGDVVEFYQQALTDQGLTERQLLHVVSDTTFSMVFDGAANGQSVVVQGVDLGNGKTNVNIRYEKVP